MEDLLCDGQIICWIKSQKKAYSMKNAIIQ